MFTKTFIFVVILQAATCLKTKLPDLLQPCKIEDMECIRNSTQTFLEKTSKGIPELRLAAIDPLSITKLDNDLIEFGGLHHIILVKILGLKNTQMKSFQMDTLNQNVSITLNISAKATGRMELDFSVHPMANEALSKYFTADLKFLATTKYPFLIREDKKCGQKHFEIGNKDITYVLQGDPEYVIFKKLPDARIADPKLAEAKNKVLKKIKLSAITKELVNRIVTALVQNLRKTATFFPTTAFFIE